MNKFQKIQLESLDNRFKRYKVVDKPRKGWINAIRNSFCMTLEQLAKRLNISTSAISQFEKGEVEGNISINTLEKVADALNCRVNYVFLPKNKSFTKIIEKQAYQKAIQMVKEVDNSMSLENQRVKNNTKSVKILAKELTEEDISKIW